MHLTSAPRSTTRRPAHLAVRLLVPAALAAGALTGCGADDTGTAASSTAAETTSAAPTTVAAPTTAESAAPTSAVAPSEAATAEITIKDFAYGDPLTVAPGTEITVTNLDTAPHDALPKDGKSWTMKLLQKSETDTFKAPSATGEYDLTCSVHPKMSGQLIVS